MPLILGTNSIKDTGYDVANSLRFNSGSSDSLDRTFSAGDTTDWTLSFWVKRSNLSATMVLFGHQLNDGGASIGTLSFESDNTLKLTNKSGGSTGFEAKTVAVFRDTSAWYHIFISFNGNESTHNDRAELYVNGVEQTWSGSGSLSSGNGTINSNNPHAWGKRLIVGTSTDRFFDGYISEAIFIGGNSSLAPTSFGEFDEDTGIWKPINISGLTFGTNGFYLDFENSGSLGADVSGNGNNFTVNNLTSIDQSTDTCTNNFCTLNPLIIFGSNNSEFKEGNLVYDDNRGDWRASVGTFGVQSGKWYWEMKLGSGTFHQVGIVGTTSPTSSANLIDLSQVHGGYSFYNDNGNLIARTNGGTISGWDSGTVGTSASTGDILMVALDMDNKFLYFGKNGTWVKSGNPTSGSSGTGAINISSDFTTGIDALPGVSMYSGSDGSLNFGSPPYSISSGNSDGNGYGNFEYAVPSGYYALNTKNLAEYG